MLGNKNALVILWTGNDMPDYLVEKIAETMTTSGITVPELMKIIYKDQEGLAQCLVREANGVSTVKFDVADNDLAKAIEQAVIYIGKRFEVSLASAKGNLIPFAIELQSALSKARSNIGFNILNMSSDTDDKALIKAVELLSTIPAVIPASLAKKYHITKGVCDVIKQIHNQFT